ncbi:MAG: flagellar filament capping protein FliD [Vulcanimicrobiaceae bacterium]|jgi:flagellar hook-associated protein 2
MSSTSGVSSSGSSDSTVYGTNVPPVSFPGIASGINYNAIIDKYVNLTLEQEKPYQEQITKLNAQQTELLKIQNLVTDFQDSFEALSNPDLFNATAPTSTNSNAVSAASITGETATPGSYTITAATLATSTQIASSTQAAGSVNVSVALANSGLSVSPQTGTNGTDGDEAQITIDGVAFQYNPNSITMTDFVSQLNTALSGVGVTANFDATTNTFSLTSSSAITVGAADDTGNALAMLKLDTAQEQDNAGTYSITSSGPLNGLNEGATFNTDENAGLSTAVTSGTFSINGVSFNVSADGNNLADIINDINQSAAGVVASYNQSTGQFVLTSKSAGPESIELGSSTDSSNFLQAVGLLSAYQTPGQLYAGADETVGQDAAITYTDASGISQTVYSNTNSVTDVVPGVTLTLQQDIGGSSGVDPVTVNVAQSTTALQTALNTFVNAYNKAIAEINTATAAPVVGSQSDDATGAQEGTQLTSGGVLFNNLDIEGLKQELVSMVTNLYDTGSSGYNSLSSIGLELDSSFSVGVATNGSSDSSDSADTTATNTSDSTTVGTQSYDGTDGKLAALDVTTLTAALQDDPTAVSQLFTSANGMLAQVGTYLTSVTGLPTSLANTVVGTVPPQSLFQTVEAEGQDEITSFQEQITSVTNQANMQANLLRTEFSDSEVQIAQLQSMQESLTSLLSSS